MMAEADSLSEPPREGGRWCFDSRPFSRRQHARQTPVTSPGGFGERAGHPPRRALSVERFASVSRVGDVIGHPGNESSQAVKGRVPVDGVPRPLRNSPV